MAEMRTGQPFALPDFYVGWPARLNPNVDAARAHSKDMAAHKYFDHTGLDKSSPGIRMDRAGYDADSGWAENIAYGFPTPEAVMNKWMNSPGHRQNILDCGLKALGVGVAKAADNSLYWTQDFGRV